MGLEMIDTKRQMTFIVEGEYTFTGCYKPHTIIALAVCSYDSETFDFLKETFLTDLIYHEGMTFESIERLFTCFLFGALNSRILRGS